MAMYLCDAFEQKRLSYLLVFKIAKYLPLKDSVDSMLTVDGYANLIVEIV